MRLKKLFVIVVILILTLTLVHFAKFYYANRECSKENIELRIKTEKFQKEINKYNNEQLKIKKIYEKMNTLPNAKNKNKADLMYLAKAIYYYSSNNNNISDNILIAIVNGESGFDKYARNGKCMSYFQIHTGYHKIPQQYIRDPFYQTAKAIEIYNYFYNKYHGDIILTLNGYNGNANYTNQYAHNILNTVHKLNRIG